MRLFPLLTSVLLAALSVHAWADEDFDDVFPGTLEVRSGRLELVRCALVQHRYILQDKTRRASQPVRDYLAHPFSYAG